jgi:trans-aconitate 2-methyltransferase
MSVARSTWDPGQYLRFADERLRPALDLIARITHPGARRVVDLGCGTGSALPLLRERFPGAQLVGVDASAAMLEKARAAGVAIERVEISSWSPPEPVDVIFSNAALHWIAGHAQLFPRLLACLAPGGLLAAQMPAMHDEPVRALQSAAAASGPWSAQLAGVASAPAILAAEAYYDLLCAISATVDIWETRYLHILRGEDPVVQWALGTSLRPYLDALSPSDRPGFLAAYSALLKPHYPQRADGSVLLPFRRLFIIATKK